MINFNFDESNWKAVKLIALQVYVTFILYYAFWIFLSVFAIPYMIQEIFNLSIESSIIIGVVIALYLYKVGGK